MDTSVSFDLQVLLFFNCKIDISNIQHSMDNSVIKPHKPTTQSNNPIVLPYLLQTFIKVIKHHRCNRSPLGALPLSSPILSSLGLTTRFRVYHLNPYFTKYVVIQTLYLILFLNTIYIYVYQILYGIL